MKCPRMIVKEASRRFLVTPELEALNRDRHEGMKKWKEDTGWTYTPKTDPMAMTLGPKNRPYSALSSDYGKTKDGGNYEKKIKKIIKKNWYHENKKQ